MDSLLLRGFDSMEIVLLILRFLDTAVNTGPGHLAHKRPSPPASWLRTQSPGLRQRVSQLINVNVFLLVDLVEFCVPEATEFIYHPLSH